MRGIELSKRFYHEFGEPLLREKFPELMRFIAVGLVGAGSECFGYDDELSRDHDFEPGFCIFVPGEEIIGRRAVFELERAYAYLPREFEGVARGLIAPVGGRRRGVINTGDFYYDRIGRRGAFESDADWFGVPDFYLAEATNGEIFFDGYGEFTAIRNSLLDIPENVRLKKLAGHLLLAAQSGQYNYARCVKHGERAAAQLAAAEFVRESMACMFLLEKRHMPYYKWSFRALSELKTFSGQYDSLEFLISSQNDGGLAEIKSGVIEDVSAAIIRELREQGLGASEDAFLEAHAYGVNKMISDPRIRELGVLYAV